MKPGVEILRELAFKKPEAMAMGYIIYAVHNNPEHLKNLRSYDIVGCSWEEALEKRKDYKLFVNKNSKVIMLKVIMQVVDPEECKIIKLRKELFPPNLKATKKQEEALEEFFVEAEQVKNQQHQLNPFVASKRLRKLHKQIVMFAGHLTEVQRIERLFAL